MERGPPPASGRRRRLLSTPEDPTTDDYAAILDRTTFSDSDVAPLGNSRTAEVQVRTTTTVQPRAGSPAEPVNVLERGDNPFSLTYIEKESTLLDNMVYVYDVDSHYARGDRSLSRVRGWRRTHRRGGGAQAAVRE